MIPRQRRSSAPGRDYPARPALALVPDDDTRLARYRSPAFRKDHPEVIILLCGPLPKAWIGSEQYVRGSLRSLLDKLDEFFDATEGDGPDTG